MQMKLREGPRWTDEEWLETGPLKVCLSAIVSHYDDDDNGDNDDEDDDDDNDDGDGDDDDDDDDYDGNDD